MRRSRSAEVAEVICPVRAALNLDDLFERVALEGGERRLVIELRLREPSCYRPKLSPRRSLSGAHLARLTTTVFGSNPGIQFVEALRGDFGGASSNEGANLIGAAALPPLNVRKEIGAREITVNNL